MTFVVVHAIGLIAYVLLAKSLGFSNEPILAGAFVYGFIAFWAAQQ